MQQSKLFELLSRFSSKQWQGLGRFLQSPYFNKREDLIAFYQFLSLYFPLGKYKNLTKARILKTGLDGKPISEKQLGYAMSQLQKLAEEFLVVEGLKENPDLQTQLKIKQLQQLGLDKQARSALEKQKKHQKTPLSLHSYREAFNWALLEYELASDPYQHRFNPLLQIATDQLDRFYMLQKLQLLCETGSQENILSQSYSTQLEEALQEAVPANDPLLQCYLTAWKIIRTDDETEFTHFIQLLNLHKETLSHQDAKTLFAYALNFCTRQINRYNNKAYYHRYLELNDSLIAHNLFLENGELPPWRYLNVVNAGLNTQQWEKTKDFINSWQSHLPATYADPLRTFCLARWHYSQNQLDAAQRLLVHVEFKDLLLSISVRSLLIRIYFEAGEDDLLHALLEASRIYLLRNKQIGEPTKTQLQNFIDATRKLSRLFPRNSETETSFLQALPPAPQLMHRDWLLQQLKH